LPSGTVLIKYSQKLDSYLDSNFSKVCKVLAVEYTYLCKGKLIKIVI